MNHEHLDDGKNGHHDVCMRTTLTIDDDVARELRELMHARRSTFKDTVNHVLRRGLRAGQQPPPSSPAYTTEVFSSGLCPGVDPLRLNQLSDELDAVRTPGEGEESP
jgi:hypothetical protein